MALPEIADTYRVTLNWAAPNRIAENVIHIGSEGGTTQDIANAVLGSIEANMWQCVSSDYEIKSISVLPLDGSLLAIEVAAPDSADFQGQGGSAYIPNASALVRHRTAHGGRSGRGRTYLPALAEDRTDDGMVAPAQRDLTTDSWNNFRANLLLEAQPCVLVVASYLHEAAYVVTSCTCEDPIATQRRRNKRVA